MRCRVPRFCLETLTSIHQTSKTAERMSITVLAAGHYKALENPGESEFSNILADFHHCSSPLHHRHYICVDAAAKSGETVVKTRQI